MTISNKMTVIALVNGMIGGIILVMPVMALRTGYLLIGPISIVLGFFSYFSCLLCLRHLKNYSDLDEAVLKHFDDNRKYKIFYDLIIVISMSVLLILYFNLICEQWEAIFDKSRLIPILNALVLFPIVYVMKKFDFGASLLGYGILSIVGYCIFLVWMRMVAPSGEQAPKTLKSFDPLFVQLAAALAQGYAIQTFFIPVLKKNGNKHIQKKLLGLTYVIGVAVYTYIGYIGAYSIVNREANKQNPETIEDYFGAKQWQVITLEIIYLVHLYSAFPEFLLVAKKRCFSVFKWPQSQEVTIKEVIYVSLTILICLIIKLTNVGVDSIIQINGGILSFFFIYVIPIGLHVKCVYFSGPKHVHLTDQINLEPEIKEKDFQMVFNKGTETSKDENGVEKCTNCPKQEIFSQKMDQGNQKEEKQIKNSPKNGIDYLSQANLHKPVEKNMEEVHAKIQMIKSTILERPAEKGDECLCDIQFTSKFQEIGEIVIMILMVSTGLFVMGYTIFTMTTDNGKE